VPTVNTYVNNDNQIDYDAQIQGSQHFASYIQRKKDLLPPIFIKGVIHFSELRNAFSDLIGPDSFSCKSTATRSKLTHQKTIEK
jgi:hypothetical protein